MGNIADKLLALLLILNIAFNLTLQLQTHLLKSNTNLTDLIVRLSRHTEIQIAVLDILIRRLQFVQRMHNTLIQPEHGNKTSCK